MSTDEKLEVSKSVGADAEALFAVLSDPQRHPEFDTSGMLRGLEHGSISQVGDEFVFSMNNDMLGDYQVKNTVCRFEQDRAVGWAPAPHPEGATNEALGDMKPGGHTFVWELAPEGSGTKVTLTYDWSQAPDPRFKAVCPVVSEEQLGESIDKLAEVTR